MFITRDDYKISIAGGLLVVGLTLAAGFTVYSMLKPLIESSLSKGIGVALKSKADFLESQIEEGLTNTYAIATYPYLIQALLQVNAQPGNANAMRDMKREMNSLLLAGFTAITVYDINSNKVIQGGHFSQNQSQKFPMHAHHDSFMIWDDNQLSLHVRKDVLDQNARRIGSIAAETRLPQLTRNLTEIREIGESVELMLCEPLEVGGQEMACLLSKVDGVEFKRLLPLTDGVALPISHALGGKSGIIIEEYRQVPTVAAYTPLGTFGMVLMQDKKEFYAPMIEQIKIIVASLIVLIIIGILLLSWLVLPLMRRLARSEKGARERLKECQCLHGIRRDMERNLQESEFYQKVIARLIQAMQFPEMTSVMIELDDKQFVSDRYNKDSMHRLQARIVVNGEAYGWLRIIYSEDQPFLLPEEQDLIDTVASVLGRWIEREQAKQRIVQMATHDVLTGLPNRYLLQDRLKQVLAHDRRTQEQAAVLFVDLDHFKSINDTLGHAAGDLLLREVAARLNANIRTEDTAARHGGDEFIILLQNITGSQEAKLVAQKILNELIQPFHIHGKELHIGGSIGIAMFPSDGNDVEDLLRSSDIAMYHAKKNGRNNYQFFSPEMNQKMAEKGSVELG
ncbi:GGDEF domain-containing protein [Nitrosomonas communis]|uniref:GGDEF domain-containing protein n=1 Tax=Nitrosomonas communis TaxID=44574 RepID=UPI0026EAD245|nr:GGDEF domain-containing protein [Nitrosomonas communis]MCO6428951.1 GGDEF domain-containing protein [Nitrosomonas communis]